MAQTFETRTKLLSKKKTILFEVGVGLQPRYSRTPTETELKTHFCSKYVFCFDD